MELRYQLVIEKILFLGLFNLVAFPTEKQRIIFCCLLHRTGKVEPDVSPGVKSPLLN